MAAGTYNVTIEQGATFRLLVEWLADGSVPVDLTGYSARMQIRPYAESDEVFLTLDSDSSNGGISFESDWVILIEITATETAALTQYCGVYDLELESADGTVTRLLKGSVTISPEVTRS
jgi:hypothetical protein